MSFAPRQAWRRRPISYAVADATTQTAEANPDWSIDLCDEGRGGGAREGRRPDDVSLGRLLVDGGAIVTGELADLAVDQCVLAEGRFTLLAPDDYRGDTLDVKVFDAAGRELARESLYAEDDEAA